MDKIESSKWIIVGSVFVALLWGFYFGWSMDKFYDGWQHIVLSKEGAEVAGYINGNRVPIISSVTHNRGDVEVTVEYWMKLP